MENMKLSFTVNFEVSPNDLAIDVLKKIEQVRLFLLMNVPSATMSDVELESQHLRLVKARLDRLLGKSVDDLP